MMAEDMELQGFGAAVAVPDWLRGLIRSIRSEAIKPKDARVKSLWDLLRQRQLLVKSPWLKALLQRIWYKGLAARSRPRTTQRLKKRLRRWRILPPPAARGTAARRPAATRPLTPTAMPAMRPVALKPVASVRPAAMQPVRPVQMPPASMKAGRK